MKNVIISDRSSGSVNKLQYNQWQLIILLQITFHSLIVPIVNYTFGTDGVNDKDATQKLKHAWTSGCVEPQLHLLVPMEAKVLP